METPSRHGRQTRVLGAAVSGVASAILALAGCNRTPPADDAGLIADVFIETVCAGEVDDAWESTTAEFKSAKGKEAFRRAVRKEPVFKKPLKRSSQETIKIGSLERLQLRYQPDDATSQSTVKVLMAATDGYWQVDSVSVEK